MNFDMAFKRLRIGDTVTGKGYSIHYLHPFSFDNPAYAILKGSQYQWLTWSAGKEAVEEIRHWLGKNVPGGMGGEWEHQMTASEANLWDVPIKHLLMPVGWSWVFGTSPFTATPTRLCVQKKTKAYTISGIGNEIVGVWYRNSGHKTTSMMYQPGRVCAIRPSTRSQNIGFVRLDKIRAARLGELGDTHAKAAGYDNLACFMEVWSQRNAPKVSNLVLLYHLTPISVLNADEKEVTPVISDSAAQLPMKILMQSEALTEIILSKNNHKLEVKKERNVI